MSLRAGPNSLVAGMTRLRTVRCMSTSMPVLYPRLTSNRFAPGSRSSDDSVEQEGGISASSSSSSTTSNPSSASSSPSSLPDRPIRTSFPERTYDDADYDPQAALAAAKENAWYLDEAEASPSTSSSTSSSTAQPSASAAASTSGAPQPRQPVFTTYDPERTTTSAPKRKIQPVPAGAPEPLVAIHGWMTSKEAAFVLDPSSVRVMRTQDAGLAMTGEGEIIKVEGAAGVGPKWEWIVTAVVRGKGKGIVGRAERALRLWLYKNPVSPDMERTKRSKLPRVPDETDWSMVQLPSVRTSINLFTWEGRERWNLEGMWQAGDKEHKTGFGFAEDRSVRVTPDAPGSGAA